MLEFTSAHMKTAMRDFLLKPAAEENCEIVNIIYFGWRRKNNKKRVYTQYFSHTQNYDVGCV